MTTTPKPQPTTLQASLAIADAAVNVGSLIFGHQVEAANQKIENAGAKIRYWTEWNNTNQRNYENYKHQLLQWSGSAFYAQQLKGYEAELAKIQADYKGEVRTAQTKILEDKMADIEAQWYEQEATDDIALDKIRVANVVQSAQKKIRNRGKGVAVGRTMVGLDAAQKNQWLQNVGNKQLTTQWRIADNIRRVEAEKAATDTASNAVRFYNPKPINDPVKPQEPLALDGYEPIDKPGPGGLGFKVASSLMGSLADAASTYDLSFGKKKS